MNSAARVCFQAPRQTLVFDLGCLFRCKLSGPVGRVGSIYTHFIVFPHHHHLQNQNLFIFPPRPSHYCPCLLRYRLDTFPISPQRRLDPGLLRRHARHAPELHLPHARLAHPGQPHAQVLQRPPREEGGGDSNPAQVAVLYPTAAEGCQSAPA